MPHAMRLAASVTISAEQIRAGAWPCCGGGQAQAMHLNFHAENAGVSIFINWMDRIFMDMVISCHWAVPFYSEQNHHVAKRIYKILKLNIMDTRNEVNLPYKCGICGKQIVPQGDNNLRPRHGFDIFMQTGSEIQYEGMSMSNPRLFYSKIHFPSGLPSYWKRAGYIFCHINAFIYYRIDLLQ